MITKNMSIWGLLNSMFRKPKGLPYVDEMVGRGFSLVNRLQGNTYVPY